MVESDYLTIKKINTHNTKNGTFYFQPTIASESNSTILKAIDAVKNYFAKGGKGCIGLHVEGPWINPLKKGAHSLKYIHSPEFDEVKKIIDYADGVISMITIAPEVVSDQIIEFLIKKEIIISIGHSDLDFKSVSIPLKSASLSTKSFSFFEIDDCIFLCSNFRDLYLFCISL